jgi:ferritin-like metal-binding protein YciE
LKQTEGHVSRLESIFQSYNEKPTGKKCKGMEGLIEEGDEVAGEDYTDGAKDSVLIGAAQRVEHYEIASYGTVRAMAGRLGNEEAVRLLGLTLQEEKDTDEKLTSLAEKIPVERSKVATFGRWHNWRTVDLWERRFPSSITSTISERNS